VWSPWGDRLLAVLAVGLALCFVWWWIGTAYLDLPLSTYLSWKPLDAPSQVPPHFPSAILHEHYFGDFQESRWWGLDILGGESPYGFLNIYPPFATWVMVPFALLPLTPAFVVYAVLSAAAILLPAWLLLRGLRPSHRVIVVSLVGGASLPLLATLDRGNMQGITIGLVGLSLFALQSSRIRWAAFLLALAICIKPFVVVLVLVALARRRRRFATNTVAVALTLTFVSWLALPGDRLQNLAAIVLSQVEATGGPDFNYAERIWANFGFNGLAANLSLPFGAPGPSSAIGLSLSVAWIAIVVTVSCRRRFPQWVWGALGLASLQLAQPYAAGYTTSWAVLAAIWFGSGVVIPRDSAGLDNEADDRWTLALRILAICALASTLLPMALRPQIGESFVAVQQVLSPLVWLVVGLVAFVGSFTRVAPIRLPLKPAT
jgi:hypothetical protein